MFNDRESDRLTDDILGITHSEGDQRIAVPVNEKEV